MAGKHVFKGTVELPQAKTNAEAVNLGQVKDLVNRYNKEPVRVATTSELAGTYSDNVLTLDSPITELDGVTLAENDAVLVKEWINTKNVDLVGLEGITLKKLFLDENEKTKIKFYQKIYQLNLKHLILFFLLFPCLNLKHY